MQHDQKHCCLAKRVRLRYADAAPAATLLVSWQSDSAQVCEVPQSRAWACARRPGHQDGGKPGLLGSGAAYGGSVMPRGANAGLWSAERHNISHHRWAAV